MAPRLSEKEQKEFRAMIQRLETLRKRLGWKQADTARFCKVEQGTYSRWVSGLSYPEPLAWAGLKALMPEIVAELRASAKELQQLLKEMDDD